MNKVSDEEENQKAAKRSTFGHMELKRTNHSEHGKGRNMDAVRLAEALNEQRELDDMLGEF